MNNISTIEIPKKQKIIEQMNIVIVGHIDHGKSTVIGRLLADTHSLPEGKLEYIKNECEKNSKPFEYAFLIDALKDEQKQGITIDSARVFFKTDKREYIIIDAPGHIEFLKNMITGAARAESAFMVIDADEGIQENSRRHGYMLSMLGVNNISVLVNKMDLVSYDESVFSSIKEKYLQFLKDINIEPNSFIPISGRHGDNIASLSQNMKWYTQRTVLETLDHFKKEETNEFLPFRMLVQGVYKFTKFDDNRRIIAGTIETGLLKKGDRVVFYPSGKKNRIKSIERFNCAEKDIAAAGEAIGFTVEEQIYISRGELVTKENETMPKIASRIKVNIFWLGKNPMIKNKIYIFKIGTIKVEVQLEKIIRIINSSNLNITEDKNQIDRNEVSECILKTNREIVFDLNSDIFQTSRFVIVDDYEITGGGIIREKLADTLSWVQHHVNVRNCKWINSIISRERREKKYNQEARLILLTGQKDTNRRLIAQNLEERLFSEGKLVYFLGIRNIVYGVDADIMDEKKVKEEHIRRLAEVAHLLLEAGLILVVAGSELTHQEVDIIKTTINPSKINIIWIGDTVTTDIEYDKQIYSKKSVEEAVFDIKNFVRGTR